MFIQLLFRLHWLYFLLLLQSLLVVICVELEILLNLLVASSTSFFLSFLLLCVLSLLLSRRWIICHLCREEQYNFLSCLSVTFQHFWTQTCKSLRWATLEPHTWTLHWYHITTLDLVMSLDHHLLYGYCSYGTQGCHPLSWDTYEGLEYHGLCLCIVCRGNGILFYIHQDCPSIMLQYYRRRTPPRSIAIYA